MPIIHCQWSNQNFLMVIPDKRRELIRKPLGPIENLPGASAHPLLYREGNSERLTIFPYRMSGEAMNDVYLVIRQLNEDREQKKK